MATTMSRPRVSSGDEIQGSTLLALFAALVALNALVAPHLAGCPIGDGGSGAKGTGGTCAATDASIGGSRDVAVFAAAMFVAATAFALVNAAMTASPDRSRHFQSAAYVNACAAFAHLQMVRGENWHVSSADGFSISGLRLLEWLFGTPVMIVLAKQLYALSREPPVDYVSAAVKLFERDRGADGVYIPPPSIRLVQADVLMLVCGCFIANLAPAPPAVRNGALFVGVATFGYVISHLSRCLAGSAVYSAIAGVRKDAKFGYALAVFNVVSWCVFPTAYFLHVSGRIDAARLDLGYAIGDAFAKFSCTMLYVTGCGRIMDLAEDEAAQRTDAQVAEQREYIRAVCAELKAPLDAIVGYGRMSADYDENGEKTPSQVRRFQRAILTSAESMRELVSQAAQYSKVHGEIHARGRMMTGKEGEDVGLPRVAWRKEGGDSRAFPLPPMLPTPGRRFSRVSRESFDGDDETDPPSSVFTLGKLQDLVVKAANIPVGFELTCEISPPAATHTEHFRANTRLLRQALATLCETAAAQPSVVRRAGGVEAARARGAPPCVRLSASLGATRKMEIAPVIDPNDESRDESLETSDLPEWTDATFTASLILDRRVGSHPSDASNSGNPHSLGVGVTPEELAKRRRLDLSTTVAKTVVTAMGGSLIRRQSDSMSGDASGDQFSFTVPLLRTSRDESECDFVPVMPLPPGRTVGAVLLRARGAVGAGAMSANHVEHVASSLISYGAKVDKCEHESDAASQLSEFASTDDVYPVLVMAADDEGDDENSWRHERLLAAAGARGSVVLFSSDASDDVTGQTTNTKPSRHRRYANDSNVVVVARNATGEEVHEALCGVLAHVAANDANPAAAEPSNQATPSEDVSNPANDEERRREKFDHSASGAWFKELGESEHLTRANSEHRKSRASHDADEDPYAFHGSPSPQKRLVDESSQKNDAIPERTVAKPEPASTASKVKHGFKDDELDGLDVLVVEDNHFQLRIVKATLQRSGVTLDVALHGAEAVAHVQRRVDAGGKLYDLILMDSMMPVMDGATATREIRAMESAYRSSKTGDELRDAGNAQPMIIVGLSAEGGPGYEQESRDAGMDGTLGKPCRPETMRKTLKEVHRGEWKRGTFQSASKRASLHF